MLTYIFLLSVRLRIGTVKSILRLPDVPSYLNVLAWGDPRDMRRSSPTGGEAWGQRGDPRILVVGAGARGTFVGLGLVYAGFRAMTADYRDGTR